MLFKGSNSGCLGNTAAGQYVLGGQHEWSQDSMKVKITSWTESFSCRSYEPCLAAHWRLRENNWHKLTDMILLSPSKHWYRVHGNFLQWPSSEGAMLPTVKYWGQEWRRTSPPNKCTLCLILLTPVAISPSSCLGSTFWVPRTRQLWFGRREISWNLVTDKVFFK